MHSEAWPVRGLVVALSAGLLFGVVSAQSPWRWENFPSPTTDLESCHTQGFASTACDPDSVLSKEGFRTLDNVLKDIIIGKKPYSNSTCATDSRAPGFKVAVAVMQRMQVSGDAASTARRFARELHNKWGVGDGSCSDGVLMLLSIEDRQVYISTGKAARQRLTDNYASTIVDSMKPNLRRGDYDGAIQQAAVDIGLVLAGSVPKEPAEDTESSGSWLGIGIFLAFLGFLLSGCWGSFTTRRQSRRCRSLLDKLKRDQAQALQQHRFPATTCPICMEDIQTPRGTPRFDEAGPSHSVHVNPDSSSSDHQAEGSSHADGDPSRAAGGSSSPSAPLLDGGTSKEDRAESTPKRPALTLPCGHTFCEECIDRWVQGKNTCPICRKPLDQDAPPPGKLADQQQQRQRPMFDQNMLAAETAFRLANLQQMYPNQINRGMLDQWTDQARHGAVIDWNNQRALALDTAAHQSFHSSNTGVSAFGGGSSFGGGGGGGSW